MKERLANILPKKGSREKEHFSGKVIQVEARNKRAFFHEISVFSGVL